MKNLKYIVLLAGFFAVVLSGCNKEDYELKELKKPTNLQVTYTIVGQDSEHPFGDGSGYVEFVATADNAISYYFDDGKDRYVEPSGKYTAQFSDNGVNTYNMKIYAVGTGGLTSSVLESVEVLSDFNDPEAVQLLTGGSSKSWYWAADQIGHLGLGPNNFDYEPGSWTWAQWYQAAPWEKIETTMYDDKFVFTLQDNGDLTFEHLNPTGEAFIQGLYAQELGLGDEGSYPFEFGGVKEVFLSPSNSIATVDGNYRGTTMTYSGDEFMGFYAGSSVYEIIEVSESILKVRMVQANEPLFAWYHTFTNVKPEQKK
ncbi:MAG: hypothetical protein KDC05_14335 [Bacteroidales bacterium]|nr:hypothetical protein [Bacteroidales bacterium]